MNRLNKPFYLCLDDFRRVQHCIVRQKKNGIEEFAPLLALTNTLPEDWLLAKSYGEFCFLLDNLGFPDMVSLDHDLDETAMEECMAAIGEGREFNYAVVKEKTGLDCVKYLIKKCGEAGVRMPKYYVHTANPNGAANMIAELEQYKKAQS